MIEEFFMGAMQVCAFMFLFGCALALFYVIEEAALIYKKAKQQRKTYMPPPNLKDCARNYTP